MTHSDSSTVLAYCRQGFEGECAQELAAHDLELGGGGHARAQRGSGFVEFVSPHAGALVARWREKWPYPELNWLGERWVDADMEDVFTAYSQGYTAVLKPIDEAEAYAVTDGDVAS